MLCIVKHICKKIITQYNLFKFDTTLNVLPLFEFPFWKTFLFNERLDNNEIQI